MNEATKRIETARNLMTTHGVGDWTLTVNRRAKTRNGLCNYTTRTIEVAAKMLHPDYPESNFLNTVTHEIAHAIAGFEAGHGPVWAAAHRALGGDGERCAKRVKGHEAPHAWTGTCPKGHFMKRHRLTARSRNSSCPKCAPYYDPANAFVWKRTA